MQFVEEAVRALEPIAVRYGLGVAPVGDDVVVLVGSDFAVQVMADFDVVHVAYIELPAGGAPRAVGLDAYLQDQRFTAEDRAQFGQPVGRTAYVLAALRVVVSGLSQRCDDILRGERAWLERLRRRDPARWRGGLPNAAVAAAVIEHLGVSSGGATPVGRRHA